MIRSSLTALLLAATLGLAALAAGHAVQGSTSPAPGKVLRFRGAVMHQVEGSITVRSLEPNHELEVRTFSYSDRIRKQMEKILDSGGYQYGDKVEIFYTSGTTVALRIDGKPSKPPKPA